MAIPAKAQQGTANHSAIELLFHCCQQCTPLQLIPPSHLSHHPNAEIMVLSTLINLIRRLPRLNDGGWLQLAILGVVVLWMLHSA
jgi:hypothetical protein